MVKPKYGTPEECWFVGQAIESRLRQLDDEFLSDALFEEKRNLESMFHLMPNGYFNSLDEWLSVNPPKRG